MEITVPIAQTWQKISLPSELISLRDAEKFIQDFCLECKVNDSLYSDIRVAVLEAASNAIKYGHQEHRARLFYIECNLYENHILKFVVSDCGEGFDFENVPDPTDSVNIEKIGGRGVYLMRKLADKCTFKKGGSEVVLEFELGRS